MAVPATALIGMYGAELNRHRFAHLVLQWICLDLHQDQHRNSSGPLRGRLPFGAALLLSYKPERLARELNPALIV